MGDERRKLPRSAEELLERYRAGERDFGSYEIEGEFVRADLIQADLRGVDLSGAYLSRANLIQADLSEANLNQAVLRGANLIQADLGRADLSVAYLIEADLRGADLREADLSGAYLGEADLSRAYLEGANLYAFRGRPKDRTSCKVNQKTYEKSDWTPNILADWHRAGARITDFDQFPQHIRDVVLGDLKGLTLHFNTPLPPTHRFLIEGVITTGPQGRQSTCKLVSFDLKDNTTIIRLQADSDAELEEVAARLLEVLHDPVQAAQAHHPGPGPGSDPNTIDVTPTNTTALVPSPQSPENQGALMKMGVAFSQVVVAVYALMAQTLTKIEHIRQDGQVQNVYNIEGDLIMGEQNKPGDTITITNPGQMAGVAIGRKAKVEVKGDINQTSGPTPSPTDTISQEAFDEDIDTILGAIGSSRRTLDPEERSKLQDTFEAMGDLQVDGKPADEVKGMLEDVWMAQMKEEFLPWYQRLSGVSTMESVLGGIVITLMTLGLNV